ncbi:hypothetical protein [Sphingomonas sp. Leaf34]|uniref:hypothetical protein n=1 Tax=Sphingomonas sp. Leaf34 TaxID=1736216 RepID=UPI000AF6DBD7|nr:hypothetical protein [Sphingomonas sp. Leaf34]
MGPGFFSSIASAFSGPKNDESEEEYLNENELNWGDIETPKETPEWDGSIDEPPERNWDE